MSSIALSSPALTSPPRGTRMPASIHAVTVSLPTLDDLIRYECQDEEILRSVRTGYPRFHIHPYVVRLQDHVAELHDLPGEMRLTCPSVERAEEICRLAGVEEPRWVEHGGVVVVGIDGDAETRERARAMLQHTGGGISSRRAEDLLLAEGLLAERQEEDARPTDPGAAVRRALAGFYGPRDPAEPPLSPSHIHLGTFGMNAVYGAFRAVTELQAREGRREWIRFGWLFMDTIHVFGKLSTEAVPHHAISSALDLDRVERLLEERGDRIAGIFAETPSNPLLHTPDLHRLRRLADRHGVALVVDATLGTPHNVDVLPLADAVIESLTKYASGSADLMMGAVVVRPSSPFAEGLGRLLPRHLEAPYERDLARLAARLEGYAERMERVNANTLALVELFEAHPSVRRVRWAYQEESRRHYEAIHRGPGRPGGLITLELASDLAGLYDRLELPKGPSLGVEFTLVGPYLYHAHYDLVSRPEGRALLAANGLDPELFRVSVGVEDTDRLLEAFERAL